MALSITIKGREAIPVRAIPLASGWNLSPDEVAKRFADPDGWGWPFRKIRAYHLPGNPTKFAPAEWNKIVVKLDALSARLKRQESEGATWVECRELWLDESIEQLPEGVFVWRDEFEAAYQKHIAETIWEAPLQEGKRELNLSPYCTDTRCKIVMAGFEYYALERPGNDEQIHSKGESFPSGAAKDISPLLAIPADCYAEMPGKMPNVSICKLAVKAAWLIERESKRTASADAVMAKLQQWADSGSEPETLIKPKREKRGVSWQTKDRVEKLYDIEACKKTLCTWMKSRD